MDGEYKEFMELGQKGHDPKYFRPKPKAIAERDLHETVTKAKELYAPLLEKLSESKRREAYALIEKNAMKRSKREAEEKHFWMNDQPK